MAAELSGYGHGGSRVVTAAAGDVKQPLEVVLSYSDHVPSSSGNLCNVGWRVQGPRGAGLQICVWPGRYQYTASTMGSDERKAVGSLKVFKTDWTRAIMKVYSAIE